MNKFLDKVPFFPITLGTILGIITSYQVINSTIVITILITVALLTIFFTVFHKYIYRDAHRYILFFITTILFFGLSYYNTNNHLPTEYDYTPYSTATIIVDKIKYKDYTSTIFAEVISVSDTLNNITKVDNQKAIIYVNDISFFTINRGDKIEIPAKFSHLTNRNNPYEFDYVNYIYNNQIHYSTLCDANEIKIIGHTNNIKYIASKLRSKLILRISQSSLSIDAQQFIRGIILGEQNIYSEDIRYRFESVGLAHVLAVSGLHVGIIFFIMNTLLWSIRITRKHRYILLIPLLLFYCFLTEESPSVVRATIMLSIYLLFKLNYRQGVTLNNTCIAAIIILMLQPLQLYNIGFQLSFLSVISISLFTHALNPFHQRHAILYYLGNIFSISIAAMVGTLAVTTYYFNSFPIAFLLANITLIPLLPFIFLIGIISLILPNSIFICNFFNLIYHTLIDYLSWIISIPILTPINYINVDIAQVILYTIAVVGIAIYMQNRKLKILITSILLIIASIIGVYRNYHNDSGENLYIMNDNSSLTIFYHKNHNGFLVFSNEDKLNMFKRNYHNLLAQNNITNISIITDTLNNNDISINFPYIQLDTISLVIINNQVEKIYNTKIQIDTVNYQVIEDGYYGTLRNLRSYIYADSTILTSNMNYQFGGRMTHESKRDSIPTFYTKSMGAWNYKVK